MSYAKRTDKNQTELTNAIKHIPGLSICDLSGAGQGVPDIMFGYMGRNILCEIKREDVSPSRSKLNDRQVEWHDNWHGQVAVVRNVDDILDLLGIS